MAGAVPLNESLGFNKFLAFSQVRGNACAR